jgi:asparagine N-glycosylation enzyme membrane subunit Stt3
MAPRGVLLAVCVLAGVGLRLLPLPDLHRDGHWVLTSGDSHYQVRRMALMARDGLDQGLFDRWAHHPKGYTLTWPAGFDGAGALLLRAAGGDPTDLDRAIPAGLLLVALCNAMAFAVAFRWGERTGGLRVAALAALALALLPIHHNYGQAGKVDHHVAEIAGTWGVLLALLWVARAEGRSLAASVLVGAGGIGAGLLLWPSSALTLGIWLSLAGLRWWLADCESQRAVGMRLAGTLALAAVLAVPLAFTGPFAGQLASQSLSLLQPVLLAAGAVGLAVASKLAVRWPDRWTRVLPAAAGVVVAMGPLLAIPGVRMALLGGGGFVGGAGFVGLIQESGTAWEGGFGALRLLGPVGVLALFAAPWLARTAWQRGDPDGVVLGVATLIGAGLTLQQLRFGALYALPAAVTFAWAADRALSPAASPRRWATVALVACLLPGLWEIASHTPPLARRVPVWQALHWLKSHAPSPGDPWRPETPANWSVLAPWGFGHEVLVVGGFANVASPFIAPGEVEGLDAVTRFWLASDPAEARAILRRHEVRYVVATAIGPAAIEAYARAIRRDPGRYVQRSAGGMATWTDAGRACLAGVLNAAMAPDPLGPWGFLRRIHATPGGRAMVYEVLEPSPSSTSRSPPTSLSSKATARPGSSTATPPCTG